MSRSGRSILWFGVYLVALSATMIIRPQILAVPLGLPLGDGLWVRLNAIPLGYLGYYYLRAARSENVPFMRWTVGGRMTVPLWLAGIVAAGFANPKLLSIGGVDVMAALWTWSCLRKDAATT